jgi:hypothetical protein
MGPAIIAAAKTPTRMLVVTFIRITCLSKCNQAAKPATRAQSVIWQQTTILPA